MQCLKLLKVRLPDGSVQSVPCGKCGFCLANRRSQWMFRIQQEMKYQCHPGWFVTLTYSEKYVRRTRSGRLSLRFRDTQLFFKRLRKAKYYAKYICVGEYGSETHRPHYHVMLWTDCPVVEFEKYWSAKNGEPLGHIHVGRLSMAAALYSLKYIMQPKQKAEDDLEPTRAQFSRGIGLDFLSCAMYDYLTFDEDNPVTKVVVDGRTVALPRYYRNKIFTRYAMRKEASKYKWECIRERRREARRLIKRGIKNAFSYMDKLRVEQSRRMIQKCKYNLTI